MNKFFTSLIVSFIPKKKLRKRLRQKLLSGKVHASADNIISLETHSTRNIRVFGRNNHISVRKTESPLHLEISIVGNNNEIVIEEGLRTEQLCRIVIGTDPCPCNNARVYIGKNTRLNDVYFLAMEDNTTVEIGEDCLFSWGINVWASDSHAIIEAPPKCPDKTKPEFRGGVCNRGHFVKIGNHVWVGMDAKIGKDVEISDGCIVGWGSIVTKSFLEKNCVIAGIPAQIVKRNRTWALPSANMFPEISNENQHYHG